MPGGLLNIASYGTENIILTGNPTKTFWNTSYKKYTNFGLQKFRIDIQGQRILNFNSETEMKFKIPRYAELLWDTYLVMNLPDIWSPYHWREDIDGCRTPYEFKWIDQLGAMMIRNIRIFSGGNVLNEYSGEYLSVIMERDENEKKHLWNEMIGSTTPFKNPAHAFQNDGNYPNANFSTNNAPAPSIKGNRLYIPLEAWFCNKGGKTALPLVALQYQEIEIQITFRPIRELYTILDIEDENLVGGRSTKRIAPAGANPLHQLWWFLQPPQDPSGVILVGDTNEQKKNLNKYFKHNTWNADIHLMSTYVFLSGDERRVFAAKKHMYLIKETYQHDFLAMGGSRRIDIPSRNMVASYAFRFRRSDVGLRNEWFNYTNWEYDNINPVKLLTTGNNGCDIPEDFNLKEVDSTVENYERLILINMGILLGAEYRENILDANVYNYVEKWIRSSGRAKDGLYLYNFAVNTNRHDYQPSGAQNTNKYQYVTFEINTLEPPINKENSVVDVLCDENGAVIGIRKQDNALFTYNYDLRVFEERYNMIVIEGGSIGLLYAR